MPKLTKIANRYGRTDPNYRSFAFKNTKKPLKPEMLAESDCCEQQNYLKLYFDAIQI